MYNNEQISNILEEINVENNFVKKYKNGNNNKKKRYIDGFKKAVKFYNKTVNYKNVKMVNNNNIKHIDLDFDTFCQSNLYMHKIYISPEIIMKYYNSEKLYRRKTFGIFRNTRCGKKFLNKEEDWNNRKYLYKRDYVWNDVKKEEYPMNLCKKTKRTESKIN